ncbi:Sodium/calcium exchanger protein [Glomus cerebriforme]|uniref:Vacuolar calcium ion transporter n=1 Tax=Glomus cerebriforme TaxID=658196 RepID=A0A397TDR5_9GLOM|nr:Sodium/calcium exchanger protein [Glomus cerebriforme]
MASSERETLSSNNSPNPDYGSTSNENTNNLNKPPSPPKSPPVLHYPPPPPTLGKSLKLIFTISWVNVLLIFIPFGFLAHYLQWSDSWVFILNFFAIIPLAKLLEFATEDISNRVGQTIGGLLNATFGNAVELIVSIVALMDGQIRVVQASMLGSIISNLLLVLGMCFVAGGFYHKTQKFNQTAAQTSSSLMALACIGLIIPAAFNFAVDTTKNDRKDELLNYSRGSAIVLLIIYCLYLLFQLKTHEYLYREGSQEDDEEPQLSLFVSLSLLGIVTVIVAFSAEYLVGSIEGIVESSGLSRTFVGLILLPIVGNAAEHVTAVTAAIKNKMDLAINVAAGSSMQIALFITPFLVILGWIIGSEMSLYFQMFETVVFFISVLITNYLIQDGESNWLEGAMLLATYAIIGLAFFFYPNNSNQ